MFFHIFKYRIKQIFHTKDFILWVLAFPLILGTLFFFAFGKMIGSDENNFEAIPIVLVSEGNGNDTFQTVVDELAKDGDDKLFELIDTDEQTALTMLENDEIYGIFYSADTISLTVGKEGINQSILKSFAQQYLQQENFILETLKTNPQKLPETLEILNSDVQFIQEISLTDGNMDPLVQYFYALIAMTCLYGSLIGLDTVVKMQGNISAIGARRETSPAHKLTVILGEFAASLFVNYLSVILLLLYLSVILKIDFGSNIPLMLVASFFGSMVGVSAGTFIGSLGNMRLSIKESISLAFTLGSCFLSGLMYGNMKDIVEHTVPIVNRINPAALISDSFYALSIYDTYDRFIGSLIMMGILTCIFCFGSFMVLRRNKYANI